jgi:hypothetical protein
LLASGVVFEEVDSALLGGAVGRKKGLAKFQGSTTPGDPLDALNQFVRNVDDEAGNAGLAVCADLVDTVGQENRCNFVVDVAVDQAYSFLRLTCIDLCGDLESNLSSIEVSLSVA